MLHVRFLVFDCVLDLYSVRWVLSFKVLRSTHFWNLGTTTTLRDRLFFHDSRLMLRYLSTATDATNKETTVINDNPKSRYRWRQPAHQLTLDGDTPLSPEELKQMVHKKMRQSLGAVADMHLSADHARETIVGLAGILDKNNIAYDTHTYEFLLSAYAKSGDYKMIMPLLEEMLDKEIRPKPSFFHRAFGVSVYPLYDHHDMELILLIMIACSTFWSSQTDGQIERDIQTLWIQPKCSKSSSGDDSLHVQ